MKADLWFLIRICLVELLVVRQWRGGSKCTGCKKAWIEAALEDDVEIHEPDSLKDYS